MCTLCIVDKCMCIIYSNVIQWNPSIVATIGERPSGLYRGVATSQGFYMMALCACAYECLAAPSRPSPISRLFHAGCTSS